MVSERAHVFIEYEKKLIPQKPKKPLSRHDLKSWGSSRLLSFILKSFIILMQIINITKCL